MDAFDYLSVLFSVIMGLALTQILQGYRALMLARSRVKVFWPALIWSALVVLIVAGAWWGMFAMRTFNHWTFAMYAAVVVQITLIYLIAGLTIPDIPPEGPVDMRAMYFAHKGWFFGLLALAVPATYLKDYVTTGHISSVANAAFLASFFGLAVIAAVIKWRWFHWLLALFSVAAIVAYTALLSVRL
jgi:hypothetical protein